MRKIVSFLKEARVELSKVIWPTRQRTIRLTTLVVIVTILFGAFIGLADLGLDRGLQSVLDATDADSAAQQQNAQQQNPQAPQPQPSGAAAPGAPDAKSIQIPGPQPTK